MRNYVSLLQDLLDSPQNILIGQTLRFDLSQNDFPILTLRPIVIDGAEITSSYIWADRKDKRLNFVGFIHLTDAYDDLPFEIAKCARIVFQMAKMNKMIAGELIIMIGKVALEDKNVELAKQMLRRWPKKSPKILFGEDGLSYELVGYNPHE